MNKKVISIILLFCIFFSLSELKAQEVLNSVYVQNHVPSKKPIPYQYVREADVMWSKTVWRKLQLKEKMNHPLYYPEQIIGERMSLMSLLLWGIKNQGLTAYDEDASSGNEFSVVLSQEQIQDRLGAGKEYTTVTDVETGEVTERVMEKNSHPEEIKELLLKEMWFFDKDFFGSASVKKVMPVLAPELSYKELNVSDGLLARRMWTQTVLEGKNRERRPMIMDDLSRYCTLDTFAMVRILEELQKLV